MQYDNLNSNPGNTQRTNRVENPTLKVTFSPAMYAALRKYTKDSAFNSEQDVIRMFCHALLKKAGYLTETV